MNRTFRAIALAVLAIVWQRCPCAVVELDSTDDIQDSVNAHDPGTEFRLTPGVYRLQSVIPREGDTFRGDDGANIFVSGSVKNSSNNRPHV